MKLSLPTLSGILKNKEKLESNFRSPGAARVRLEEHPELEKCLWYWFSDCRAHNLPISDAMLLVKAKEFGEMIGISDLEFKYSKGWLDKFKDRRQIRAVTVSGESRGVEHQQSLKQELKSN